MTFANPLLLIGLLAAGIPLVLHLLASVRAQDVEFPTLRFLQISMERTARRRRVQHWFLLLLRSLLIAILALAVAEPITRIAENWIGSPDHAAVIVLDNSFSMAVKDPDGSRFSKARRQAASLLSGSNKPTLAELLITSGLQNKPQMTTAFEDLRSKLRHAEIRHKPSRLVPRIKQAIELLEDQSAARKTVFLLSDMQSASVDPLAQMRKLADLKDIRLLLVNLADHRSGNVALTQLEVRGSPMIHQAVEILATVRNSFPTDRVVDVQLHLDNAAVQHARCTLQPHGDEGSVQTLRFSHVLSQSGSVTGRVTIDPGADDALPQDNVRYLAFRVAPKAEALVISGPANRADPTEMTPGGMLSVALTPYGKDGMWSVNPREISYREFTPRQLAGIDAAFFCNVPRFNDAQAEAMKNFVRRGNTAVFFTGSDVDIANYNRQFASGDNPMFRKKLAPPVGEVDPTRRAKPVFRARTQHPLLSGLYENEEDYLSVLVQRHHRTELEPQPRSVLMYLEGGDPLFIVNRYGEGRCAMILTTASPKWSNFPLTGLFLPVMNRLCLPAVSESHTDAATLAGSPATIRIPLQPEDAKAEQAVVNSPMGDRQWNVELHRTGDTMTSRFEYTNQPGLYRYAVSGLSNRSGAIAVNPRSEESELQSTDPETLQKAMQNAGAKHVYTGNSVADVLDKTRHAAMGRNWWDVLLAVVVVLLVTESVIANRPAKEPV